MPAPDSSAILDRARLDALARYQVLDTEAETAFDDIVELAKLICDTPVALVSLVAADRQWFKAKSGFETCETSLDRSVCAHAVAERSLLVIPDLTQDPRTLDNPLVVAAPHIRFYAGAPLETPDGFILGTLCVIDDKPRPQGLTETQVEALRALARQVVGQLELRRSVLDRQADDRRYRLLFDAMDTGVCIIAMKFDDAGHPVDYRFLEVNQAFEAQTGIENATGRWMKHIAPTQEQHWFDLYGGVATSRLPVRFDQVSEALGRWFEVYAFPVGEPSQLQVGIIFTDITERRRTESESAKAQERLHLALSAGKGIGTWDWDVRRSVVTADRRFAELYGIDPNAAEAGVPLHDFFANVHKDDVGKLEAAIDETLRHGGSFTAEYRIVAPDGVTWVAAQGACSLGIDGKPLRFPGVSFDITDRMRAEERREALFRLGEALREAASTQDAIALAAETLGRNLKASRAGYAVIDSQAESILIERDWVARDVESIGGLRPFSSFRATIDRLKSGETLAVANIPAADMLKADAATYASMKVLAQINVPLLKADVLVGAMFVHNASPRTWSSVELEFAHAVADRTYAALATLEAEQEQQFLNLELSHRMKNTLAMVQAIAAQTLRGVTDRDAVEAFGKRLMALSRAHDVLLRDSWASARIRPTIESVLGLHADFERISVSGPDILLGPKAVLSISLLLHELATNAHKYGALSQPAGTVELTWSVSDSTPASVNLDWVERGGPAISAPTRRGFGSRLIGMGLAGTGSADIRYESSGLIARFSAPLALMSEV